MKENDLIALGFTKEEFIPGNYDFNGIMDYDYVLEFKADENSKWSGFRLRSSLASECDDEDFYVYFEDYEKEFVFTDKTDLKHLIRVLKNAQPL